MIGIESFGGQAQAATLIGIVLLEAIVLYVGYGTLESIVGPTITDFLQGD